MIWIDICLVYDMRCGQNVDSRFGLLRTYMTAPENGMECNAWTSSAARGSGGRGVHALRFLCSSLLRVVMVIHVVYLVPCLRLCDSRF